MIFVKVLIIVMSICLLILAIYNINKGGEEYDSGAYRYNDYKRKMENYIHMYLEPGEYAALTFAAIKPLLDKKYNNILIWKEESNMLFFRKTKDDSAIPIILDRENYDEFIEYTKKLKQLEIDGINAETTIMVSEDIRNILRNEIEVQEMLREMYAGTKGIYLPRSQMLSTIRERVANNDYRFEAELAFFHENRGKIIGIRYDMTEQKWFLETFKDSNDLYTWNDFIQKTPDALALFKKMFNCQVNT